MKIMGFISKFIKTEELFLVHSREGPLIFILMYEKEHRNGHEKSEPSPAHTVSYFQQRL